MSSWMILGSVTLAVLDPPRTPGRLGTRDRTAVVARSENSWPIADFGAPVLSGMLELPAGNAYGATGMVRMSMLAPAVRASSRSRSTVPSPVGMLDVLDSTTI